MAERWSDPRADPRGLPSRPEGLTLAIFVDGFDSAAEAGAASASLSREWRAFSRRLGLPHSIFGLCFIEAGRQRPLTDAEIASFEDERGDG